VNNDPYGDGWMIKVRLSDPGARDRLMSAAAYKAHVGE
jgi:glycine cleavage system H protein